MVVSFEQSEEVIPASAARSQGWGGGCRSQTERLLHEAAAVARPLIASKLRSFESLGGSAPTVDTDTLDDLLSETLLRVAARLQQVTDGSAAHPVDHLHSFARAVACNVCCRHFREESPEWQRCKNAVVYALGRDGGTPALAHWTDPHGRHVCGLASVRNGPTPRRSAKYMRLVEQPSEFVRAALPSLEPESCDLRSLLSGLLAHLAEPVEIVDLVTAIAALRGARHVRVRGRLAGVADGLGDRLVDPAPVVVSQVERRIFARRLWTEIQDLSEKQACAVLLNLRDHRNRGVIALIVMEGMASFEEIADAVGMPPEQLASLWPRLPARLPGCLAAPGSRLSTRERLPGNASGDEPRTRPEQRSRAAEGHRRMGQDVVPAHRLGVLWSGGPMYTRTGYIRSAVPHGVGCRSRSFCEESVAKLHAAASRVLQ